MKYGTISQIRERLIQEGILEEKKKVTLRTNDAKDILTKCLEADGMQWLECYEPVADWMTDNKGKGLLILGQCGTGKTTIARALAIAINYLTGKIPTYISADKMNQERDILMQRKIIILDDAGKEGIRNDYGDRSMAFSDIVDSAERRGALLIITSNLGADGITEKYGERTTDRLAGICRMVAMNGKSLRK